MISGYLLLGKVDTWKKAAKRFLRIVSVLIVCAAAYAAWKVFWYSPETPISRIWQDTLHFYRVNPSNALWYLYAYLGILLMLPFLQKMAAAMSKKDYWVFFGISGFFVGLLPILGHYFEDASVNAYFELPLFGGYICMMMIGQYFARFGIRKSALGFIAAVLLFIGTVAFNVGATYLEYQKDASNYLFFDNRVFLPIVLGAACVFYMASFIRLPRRSGAVVSYIGGCTFGIYLVSDMAILSLDIIYQKLCLSMSVFPAMLLFEAAIFLIGLAVIAPIKWIPGIKKIL